jgi:iron complex outermembrane receptor protein
LPAFAQSGAPAAQPNAQSVENIVVTAQKRTQKVQNVPIGITVINGQQLQRQQIQTVQDLSQSAASLEFAPTSNAPGGGATVRGIGTETFQPGAQASVGLVVDGVPLGNLNTNNLFDVARVEVLRGPQGMLFGSSVSGGVINLTTNAPDPSHYYAILHADLAPGSAGDYKNVANYVWNGIVNLPISDNSAVRVSAFGNYLNGLYHNDYTNKDSTDTDQGVRVHYLVRPTQDITVNIIGDYEKINNLGYQLFVPVGGYPASTNALLLACGEHESFKNNQDCSNFANASIQTNKGVSLQIDDNTGLGTVTNIASFRESSVDPNPEDILGAGPGAIPEIDRPIQSTYQRQITEELRLASPSSATLEYTAGFFFNHYDGYKEGQPLNIILPFGRLFSGTDDHSTIESEALFGQLTYHLLPGLRLIAGGRLQRESVSDTGEQTSSTLNFVPFPLITTTTLPVSGSGTVDNASWRVGAEYDVRADTHAYFTITRGYKGPQVSDGIPGQFSIIAPEIPTDYEVGVKSAIFDDRLALDLNLFHDDVKDFQGQTCAFPNGALVCTPSSVPHVLTQGVEFDAFGRPIPPLSINASVLYDDARYPSGYVGSDGSDLSAASLVNATRFKFTLNGEYDWELANGQEIYLDDTTDYKSDVRLYPAAGKEYVFNAHFILGAKLGWRLPGRGWGVAVFVKNLLDAHEPVQIYPNNPGDNFVLSPNSTRLIGVSLDAKF